MIRILKFAKKYWASMLIIIALLVGQATCELALPQYTSNIVDVGIQNGGIETEAPEVMRQETMELLMRFLNEQERQTVQEAYVLYGAGEAKDDILKEYPAAGTEGVYVLEGENREEIEEILIPAETVFLTLRSEGEEAQAMRESVLEQMGLSADTDPNQVLAMLPDEALQAIKEGIIEEMGNMGDTMLSSMGVAFVKDEYAQMGMDMEGTQMGYLGGVGLQMLGLALLGMLFTIAVAFLSSRMAARTSRDLRSRIFHKVVSFSNEEMSQFSTSSLITRCTNDVQQVQMVLMLMFRMVIYAPILGIGGILKVLQTRTHMEWIIVVAVVAVLALVAVLMAVAMPKFKIMQKLVDRLNLVSREILTGTSVIRAFSREKYEEKRFDGASRNLMKTQLFTSRTMALMMPAMMFVMNGITVLIVWVGAHGIDMGTLQVGDMMAFITYTMQIVMAFLMITMVSVMLPRAAVAAERIQEVLDSETKIENPEHPEQVARHSGRIVFDHVSFRYPGSDEDVLTDMNFTAESGQTTAIIGSTGSGKSTLVQLIPRLFDVTKGRITIDGVDVRNMDLHELRGSIGYVPQKGVLFSGTIDSNLRFGAQDASEVQIREAAEIAQALDFIEEKPEGFEAPIAQGGTNVSGGQKQRLSIARAIAKNPKLYVFDDSFSALDYKTDFKLRQALSSKVSQATVVIVAQRINTILHADKILVLDEGKIVGEGTHEELLAHNEIYRQIAQSQLSQEELTGSGKEVRHE